MEKIKLPLGAEGDQEKIKQQGKIPLKKGKHTLNKTKRE